MSSPSPIGRFPSSRTPFDLSLEGTRAEIADFLVEVELLRYRIRLLLASLQFSLDDLPPLRSAPPFPSFVSTAIATPQPTGSQSSPVSQGSPPAPAPSVSSTVAQPRSRPVPSTFGDLSLADPPSPTDRPTAEPKPSIVSPESVTDRPTIKPETEIAPSESLTNRRDAEPKPSISPTEGASDRPAAKPSTNPPTAKPPAPIVPAESASDRPAAKPPVNRPTAKPPAPIAPLDSARDRRITKPPTDPPTAELKPSIAPLDSARDRLTTKPETLITRNRRRPARLKKYLKSHKSIATNSKPRFTAQLSTLILELFQNRPRFALSLLLGLLLLLSLLLALAIIGLLSL